MELWKCKVCGTATRQPAANVPYSDTCDRCIRSELKLHRKLNALMAERNLNLKQKLARVREMATKARDECYECHQCYGAKHPENCPLRKMIAEIGGE